MTDQEKIALLEAQLDVSRYACDKACDIAAERNKHAMVSQVQLEEVVKALKPLLSDLDQWESDYEKITPDQYMELGATSRSDLYLELHKFKQTYSRI